MAPNRSSERAGKEGAWVKKNGSGGAEKSGDTAEEEKGPAPRNERRENGRGRGRQPRGRREPREKEGMVGETVDDGTEVRGIAMQGRGNGAQRGSRRGMAQEPPADEKENRNTKEIGDEFGGSALEVNLSRATRYTRSELLSIAKLPASNIKPSDLNPLIDKDNKDSHLCIRMIGSRQSGGADADDGIADYNSNSLRERRERREERRGTERGGSDDVDVPNDARPRRSQREVATAASTGAPGGATGSSTPKGRRTGSTSTATVPDKVANGEEDAEKAALRASLKWLKKGDQQIPTSSATMAGGNTPHATGVAAVSQNAASPTSGTQGFPASCLQQQQVHTPAHVQAHAQAHAMQAAAFIQGINALNAAAGRGAYAGGLPWGYSPYQFPYLNPYGAYPPNVDFNIPQQASGFLAAAQAAAANGLNAGRGAGSLGAGNVNAMGAYGANPNLANFGRGTPADIGANPVTTKATPKPPKTPASPHMRASNPGAQHGKKVPHEAAANPAANPPLIATPYVPTALPEASTKMELVNVSKDDTDAKTDDDDEAGCNQS